MSIEWVFDPTPPSGARLGGDVAERAFRPEIPVFVREVLQNAKDQHVDGAEPVSVLFHLIELRDDDVDGFLESLGWRELHPHLLAASGQPNGASIRRALRALERKKELLLLCVHDGHTTGLRGPETGQGNFAALCRDRLFSEKSEAQSSGGSHGLGKAVLWRFSALSTVVFCSTLAQLPAGQENPRFIARTNLPWHKLGSAQFAGDGWLGVRRRVLGGDRAESIWGEDARRVAQRLRCARMRAFGTGTSLLVVGFHEPADEHQPAEMVRSIASAAADSFWPSLRTDASAVASGGPSALRVHVRFGDGEKEQVADFSTVQAFVDAVEAHRRGGSVAALQSPGQVLAVPIPVSIPQRVDGLRAPAAAALLLIRLAEPDTTTQHLNSVALVRGAGMVVQYKPFERLSLTARPFHAVLLAGLMRDPAAPTQADRELEAFLRAAEPPEHDQWVSTARLKEQYRPGYKKALDELFEVIRKALREAVSERMAVGSAGPDLLARKFPIGPRQGGGKPKQAFHFRGLRGELTPSGAWRFSGELRAVARGSRGWEATVDLRFGGESSGGQGGGLIREFSIDAGRGQKATCVVENGRALVRLPPTADHLRFEGESDVCKHPVDAHLSVAELIVEGRLSEEGR